MKNLSFEKEEDNEFESNRFNPTPVHGGRLMPPHRKIAITPKNNDLEEPKLCYFSYISMTKPSISFWGLKMAEKGDSIAFLLSVALISESKNLFFSLL